MIPVVLMVDGIGILVTWTKKVLLVGEAYSLDKTSRAFLLAGRKNKH